MSATTIQVQVNAETQRTRRSADQVEGRMTSVECMPLTPALSPSDGERVASGRVRGTALSRLLVRIFCMAGKFFPLGESPRSPRLCVNEAILFPNRP